MRKPAVPIERAVTVLTPVFAAFASWLTTLVATHVPGAPRLDPGAVAAVAAAAFVGTVGIVAKWLHGRQIPEIAGINVPGLAGQVQVETQAFLAAHATDLKASEQEIQAVVDGYLASHMPSQPDVDAIVQAVIARISQGLGASSPTGQASTPGTSTSTVKAG